jgi:hypothetical protein
VISLAPLALPKASGLLPIRFLTAQEKSQEGRPVFNDFVHG